MHVDLDSLDNSASRYRLAGAEASKIASDLSAASSFLATGIDGDTARRADEKITATQSALADAESMFRSAAHSIETLSDTLSHVKADHISTDRLLSQEGANLKVTVRQLAGESDAHEITRLKKKIKTHKGTIKRYEGTLRTLEDEAKEASKRAANELEDLTGWADAAQSAAFYKTPMGRLVRFGKGFVVDGVVGTLDGLEDLTVRFLYDHEGAIASWQALGSFLLAVNAMTSTVNPMTSTMSYAQYKIFGDDQTYDEYMVAQGQIVFGGLKTAVHWDEFAEDPWRASGAVGWDVLTLVAGVGVPKLAKLQAAGKMGTAGKASLATLKVVEAIDDPLRVSRILPTEIQSLGPGIERLSQVDRSLVPLTPNRIRHITERHGFGAPQVKSLFPQSWTSIDIQEAVAQIVRDPNLQWRQQTGSGDSLFTRSGEAAKYVVESTVNGVKIRVIIQPAGEGVVTAFPIY